MQRSELQIPPQTAGDNKATEVIRVWIAHQDLHVSMRIGMWKDCANSEVDERDAWGELLSDITRHVANGLMQECGWDFDATRDRIRAALLQHFDDKAGDVSGSFTDSL